MKANEIKDLSIPEIEKKLRETRDDLTKLRMRKQLGQVEKPHELKALRRDIARMLTVINEKKKAEVAA